MIDWVKEHKTYAIAILCTLLVGAVIYFYFNNEEQKSNELNNQWVIGEEIAMEEQEIEQEGKEEKPVMILVDIKGAVVRPGVYEVEEGERVIDVIEKAGGLKKSADELKINFAKKVTDEMVLYIPRKGEEGEVANAQAATSSSSSSSGEKDTVNINTATETELTTLPGIGPSKAQAIIEYRETNGPYKSVEELTSVTGIGEKTIEKLKENITVK